jgi:F420-dependent oxidoreductase-like protein
MRLRIMLEPRHGATYEETLTLALAAEDAGFDAFFRSDHLFGVDPADPLYRPTDSWTTLAGLARDTTRVRLGTLLTAGTYREPGLLAVIVATAQAMSGGRVELGLGAGWYAAEHAAYGIAFPSLKERFDRLEESLAIITGLWRTPPGVRFTHSGALFGADGGVNPLPGGPATRPPIVVGGSGPRRTPALAARYADEFNATFPTGAPERYATFHRACARVGRDPATVRQSVLVPVCCGDRTDVERRREAIGSPRLRDVAICGTPSDVAERLDAIRTDGADTIYLHVFDPTDLDHIRLLGAEVLPALPREP